MNKVEITVLSVCISMIIGLSLYMASSFSDEKEVHYVKQDCELTYFYINERLDVESTVMMALMKVESNYETDAVNPTSGASGVLQIMPIYVEECNRIVGANIYSIDDAFSLHKSIEMFTIMNSKHNKSKTVEEYIRIHNPNGSKIYKQLVLEEYNKIAKYEAIRFML